LTGLPGGFKVSSLEERQALAETARVRDWTTRLIHPEVHAPPGFASLAPAIYRGSTTLFARAADAIDNWDQSETPYSYGLYGTPTTLELAARLTELEGGYKTFLTPGGQSAISLIDFALLGAGDHVLIPESVYAPNRSFATDLLTRFGVEVELYPPMLGAGVSAKFRTNTRLVWCESPGSVTMEVQDIPAISTAAHARGILVALDNTYAAGVLFRAFEHGVDVTMQALTKYVGGHSDLLLGSVTVPNRELYTRIGGAWQSLGFAVSPDDCALAMRGLQTMAVRLAAIEKSALEIATWLARRPEVEVVLHPALPSCPGHDIWRRDFTGSAGVFSFILKDGFQGADALSFADSLKLFPVGYSWGGVTSLAMPYIGGPGRPQWPHGDRLIRLNIGLEDTRDLIEDLTAAFAALPARAPGTR
jgi:cysteine-S-conjugate beta-lyase